MPAEGRLSAHPWCVLKILSTLPSNSHLPVVWTLRCKGNDGITHDSVHSGALGIGMQNAEFNSVPLAPRMRETTSCNESSWAGWPSMERMTSPGARQRGKRGCPQSASLQPPGHFQGKFLCQPQKLPPEVVSCISLYSSAVMNVE